MLKTNNATQAPGPVSLPSLNDVMNDLILLRQSSISLSQTLALDLNDSTKAPLSKATSLEKLALFKASADKSQKEEGVVENGFEVASDFLQMQQQLTVSQNEMDTLQDRMAKLERELTEVGELITLNPIK